MAPKKLFAKLVKTQKEILRERKLEQIEKLLINSFDFIDPDALFDLLCQNVNSSYRDDFDKKVKEYILIDNSFLIGNMDLCQEHELKEFCKEKDIKLTDYYNC